jgi:acyl-coenzyme A thioesterase PaaI-like protein
MGPLIIAATGGAKFPVTLDLHTTYFMPAPIGPRAMVEARIDRVGGTAVFTSASIASESGEMLARAVQTAMLRNVGYSPSPRHTSTAAPACAG